MFLILFLARRGSLSTSSFLLLPGRDPGMGTSYPTHKGVGTSYYSLPVSVVFRAVFCEKRGTRDVSCVSTIKFCLMATFKSVSSSL